MPKCKQTRTFFRKVKKNTNICYELSNEAININADNIVNLTEMHRINCNECNTEVVNNENIISINESISNKNSNENFYITSMENEDDQEINQFQDQEAPL